MILGQTEIYQKAAPNLIPVYFLNVKRGTINVLRRALWGSLPSWSVVGLSFIGGSVLEVLTDGRHKNRLVATLQGMGLKEVINFGFFKPIATRRILTPVRARWQKKETTSTSTASPKGIPEIFRLWSGTSVVPTKGGRGRKQITGNQRKSEKQPSPQRQTDEREGATCETKCKGSHHNTAIGKDDKLRGRGKKRELKCKT